MINGQVCKSLLASTPREMKKRNFRVILWIGAGLLLAPWQGLAQGTTTPPAAPQAAATQAAAVFKPEEVDQILAPIALYPDDLLAPVLMASTYPVPAQYGVTGIMTFVVNHDGVVFQKDLGPDTTSIAEKISLFDPGSGWRKQ
jgi:hypothetical protein